ncbi:PTS sugar transporter [Sporolactobacillus sp. THM7-7]|nr:PTS sugar transporter [Sporolactobacillus sp. THM7-7]
MKKIIVIGSSGGNLFHLGGSDPETLLKEIMIQSEANGFHITGIQFIAAEESLDRATDTTVAVLYGIKSERRQLGKIFSGSLKKANEKAALLDRSLAQKIRSGEVDGLVVMSADPEKVNKEVVDAAVEKNIPIVGTGGSSMSFVESRGANVISASGTTGTTNRTRAIAFISALCRYWKINDRSSVYSKEDNGSQKVTVNLPGIMVSGLPGFIALSIVLATGKFPVFSELNTAFDVIIKALPIIISVLAAKQITDLGEVTLVAGILAGAFSASSGIIGGLVGGILAGLCVRYLLKQCIQWQFPMTATNILTGSFGGLIPGIFLYYFSGTFFLQIGRFITSVIQAFVSFNPLVMGFLAGVMIWFALLKGGYHAVILPLILLEMEKTGSSFLGAIDMIGLVSVAAGINLAHWIYPLKKTKKSVTKRGLGMNIMFGTFVESVYPLLSNKVILFGALFSAGTGSALTSLFHVHGTAYVPLFIAPFLSTSVFGFTLAMLTAMGLSFLITLTVEINSIQKTNKN